MKKDFSQELEHLPAYAFLIIEVDTLGHFVLFAEPEDVEEYGEIDSVKTLDLDLGGNESAVIQVARYLASEGFMLNRLRELVRETRINFSFIDDTPGREQDAVVLYAQADVIDRTLFESGKARLVSLDEYAKYFGGLMFSATTALGAGIAQLVSERKIIG